MKKIALSFFLTFLFFVNINKVGAASGSATISASNKVTVGSTFTVTVTMRANVEMSAFQYELNYDTSHLTFISGDAGLAVADSLPSRPKTKTVKYKFKAKSVGSATLKITGGKFTDWLEDKEVSTTNGSKTIQIVEASGSNKNDNSSDLDVKSSNTYLKSLTVDKGNLNPSFKKDVEEYELLLEAGTTSINISPKAEDSKSSVNIEGKVDVKEGDNTIQVKVTAENGDKRIYTIHAYVEESNPIKVNVGDSYYSVVKRTSFLNIPDGFSEEKYNLKGEEVPTFISDNKKIRLIGLKDKDGNYVLAIIDKGKYILFKNLNVGNINILVIPFDEDNIPVGYKKGKVTINDVSYDGYKEKSKSDFILFYGINSNTGYKNIYSYDIKEGTIQRYVKNKNAIDDKILLKSGIVVISCFISFIIAIIYGSLRNKVKNLD